MTAFTDTDAISVANIAQLVDNAALAINMDHCAACYRIRLNIGGDIIKRQMSKDNTAKFLEWARNNANRDTYVILTSAQYDNIQMIKHSSIFDILVSGDGDR